MLASDVDRKFSGTIPQLYEQFMVPLIFIPYAEDLGRRAALLQPADVLEIAAGTGVVTRQLAQVLAPNARIVATDLNQPMLDQAAARGTVRPLTWQQADAMQLPFTDASFDLVVCQFGAMFFPDKAHAFGEARRVLRPGGTFLFNVWDAIEHNEFADAVTAALGEMYPADPPRFMARVPHGYCDKAAIAADLRGAGFVEPVVMDTVQLRSRAVSAQVAATAYCQGSPLRGEIEARGGPGLEQVTALVEAALAARFGTDAVEGRIQAHIIQAAR